MNAQPAAAASAPFDVVAFVTSAGGLEALSTVLADLTPDFAAALVVGQHLGADSALAEILASRTALPVEWIREGKVLRAGCVHVCPPHQWLEILPDRSCALHAFGGARHNQRPLDRLLGSLADSCGARAMAIVLTGMGRDGSSGARAVRAAGGAVITQTAASAAYPDMPRAVVEAGAADLVLPLADIGRVVAGLVAGGPFPQPRNEREARDALFAGPGAARAALRAVDWARTAAGGVRDWPQGLKAIVTGMLHARFPSCIFWGPDSIQIYNDAWISVLGAGHPEASGMPARASWQEAWSGQVGSYRSVLQTGEGRYAEDQLLEVHRRGFAEEAYFTISHSPLHDDHGAVQGVLTIATETTARVLAARRQQALRALAGSAASSGSVAAACAQAGALLGELARDIPFVLLYLADAAGLRANLCLACGLPAGSAAAPHAIELLAADTVWPLDRVLRQAAPLHLDDLATRLRGAHAGPWAEAPGAALLLPVRTGEAYVGGVMVAGLSPRLPFDRSAREFHELVAQQVGANMADAWLREREGERAADQADADRSRAEFFSSVALEFRKPLTVVLGPLDDLLALGAPEAKPLRRELEIAARSARRLLTLVDTLLDCSQDEAGRGGASLEETDLAALTRDIAGLFRGVVERAGLTFAVDCPPLPQPVGVDTAMWERIVSNLLSNALKFTFDGGITVRLRPVGQYVELCVSDTGVGIPPAELSKVFRRFHRVRGTRSRSEEGAGMGLALVHEFVQLHHGRMRLRSHPGEGTTFTVWLNAQAPGGRVRGPLPIPAGARASLAVARQLAAEAERWSQPGVVRALPAAVAEASVARPRAWTAHVPGARLLVVDGDGDMRDYLASTLGGQWQVMLAADGAQALALARSEPPDLVLAEASAPVLDGVGLLRALRADDALKAVPLVLVTPRADEEAAIGGLLAGADDYIASPFSSRELLARVAAQLELARLRSPAPPAATPAWGRA